MSSLDLPEQSDVTHFEQISGFLIVAFGVDQQGRLWMWMRDDEEELN